MPSHEKQSGRLRQQLTELEDEFERYKASVSGAVAGFEPETVLVIEIAGSVEDFKQAIDETEGLEWLGEWDVEDIEPNADFYVPPKIGVNFFKQHIGDVTEKELSKEIRNLLQAQGFIDGDGILTADDLSPIELPEHLENFRQQIVSAVDAAKRKLLSGKLFISMGNQQGLDEILRLWRAWEAGEDLPYRRTKWRDVFAQTLNIRRWGIGETLHETGMIDRWRDILDPINPDQEIHCQIELFYRRNLDKRRETEIAVRNLLAEIEGVELSPFLDMKEIAFHAVKVSLPAAQVRSLLDALDSDENELGIQLFKFPGVMYFRPTGQSLVTLDDGPGMEAEFPEGAPELPPVAAILDGAPNLQHDALRDRLLFDDPDNLLAEYQPGERKHGTAMASLAVHGELYNEINPLSSHVYCLPVMQPNPAARDREEHFPDHVFFEDRIERAVRRMIEGEGEAPAQAPTVKIINLSIGDPERPFVHTPSPWARLLDWLSWKYRVLFCVSAGNYKEGIDVGVPNDEFAALPDDQKIERILKCIDHQLSHRRLLSPAESLNAVTVGSTHTDSSGDYDLGQRMDVLPDKDLFSPVCRFGHGFRRSVKPEILFPGGRQLFRVPARDDEQIIFPDTGVRAPGQQVAWDSGQEGERSKTVFTRGTSNATALATRSAVRIYEVLTDLKEEHNEQIPEELMSVLVKALLVHGARHGGGAKDFLSRALKNSDNSRRFKEVVARYVGYGPVDIERVLACTEQRATVIGAGEIHENEIHEYRFPLPAGLSGRNDWRRMVVTLAWFTPINPEHRNLREVKLTFRSAERWNEAPLKLERVDTDHNQVSRGTVQHEVLEGRRQISAYQDDGHVMLHITCRPDATESLDNAIPYGLAITLEVAEGVDVPIYEQVQARIRAPVPVGAAGGDR